jgi:hypothetical protein
LLYAGTTSIFSFKYSIFKITVKKLKLASKSAGNNFNLKIGTSETLRNGTVVHADNVKPISVPKHLKPICDVKFGHYLAARPIKNIFFISQRAKALDAGLIDGRGYFSSKQQLVIIFHSLDPSLAFYIKKRLGFGCVKKVQDKHAFIFVLAAKRGIDKVINLVNGKISASLLRKKLYLIK